MARPRVRAPGNPVILTPSPDRAAGLAPATIGCSHEEAQAPVTRFLLAVMLGVVVLMVFSWALGRIIFWLRATFPPNPRPRRRR
jgi:hypothetical protein